MGVTQSRCEEEEQHTEARGVALLRAAKPQKCAVICLCISAWDLRQGPWRWSWHGRGCDSRAPLMRARLCRVLKRASQPWCWCNHEG